MEELRAAVEKLLTMLTTRTTHHDASINTLTQTLMAMENAGVERLQCLLTEQINAQTLVQSLTKVCNNLLTKADTGTVTLENMSAQMVKSTSN